MLVELRVAFDRFGLLDVGIEPRTDLTKGVVALKIILVYFRGSGPGRFPMDVRFDVRCAMKIGGRNPRVRRCTNLVVGLDNNREKRDAVFLNVDRCESGIFVGANFAADLVVPAASLVRHVPGRLPTAIVRKRRISLADDTISIALYHPIADIASRRNRQPGFHRVTHHSFQLHDLPGPIEVAISNDRGTMLCCGASALTSRLIPFTGTCDAYRGAVRSLCNEKTGGRLFIGEKKDAREKRESLLVGGWGGAR